eukprot:7666820-Lingulodinium_polyedra.AAC.1
MGLRASERVLGRRVAPSAVVSRRARGAMPRAGRASEVGQNGCPERHRRLVLGGQAAGPRGLSGRVAGSARC